MQPFIEVLVVSLLICTTNANHSLRGCQDVDPMCALIDEIRALNGMVEYS